MTLTTLPLLLLLAAPQEAPARAQDKRPPAEAPREAKESDKNTPDDQPVVTSHELKLAAGRVLKYTVTTGTMPIRNAQGEVEAHIFFMAYTADRPGGPGKRPLMFSFNGGPGSSSVWLHLGALGPKRVKMRDDGMMPSPPYELVDNENTWLDATDLVFIDPVGTGYSRPAKPELGKKFWGLQGDLESVAEFIRLYLTRYERWASPLFVVGESYGTTRAAGLSGLLVERHGVAFNGVILVSSILNMQTARFTKGNDTPYPLFLPTYTATAWYHKKLPPDLGSDLKTALAEAEAFAAGEYTLALAKGDRMSPQEKRSAVEKLARLTGLSATFVERSNLRITQPAFCKELLRSERRTAGRLDSRFKGIDESAADEAPDFDPSMAAIRPPYTAAFNDYVRRALGYKSDQHYYILGGGFQGWEYPQGQFPDTSEALRSAFSKNPAMRVFVASGHYDLATPYYGTEYTLAHMGLDPIQRERVEVSYYEAGHMMYIAVEELGRLKSDVSAFVTKALQP